METAPNAEVIRATQDCLGKFVKRPPLTEKLLLKPPFRFLHDIVTSVLQNHGFFEGLFEESELKSENVKEREAKIAFLNKVIAVLSLTTGKSLPVKPSKIISGQEPENTNKLLQCLGEALENNLSTTEAVKTYQISSQNNQGDNNTTKKSQDSSLDKHSLISKKVKSDSTIASKGRDSVIKQSKKENKTKQDGNKKDKRDVSRESQKSRRDTSISRKDGKKETIENFKNINKEKIIPNNKSTTNKKTQDKLNTTSALTSKSSDNVLVSHHAKRTNKSDSIHNIDNQVGKDAEEKAIEDVVIETAEKTIIKEEGLKLSDLTVIDNESGYQTATKLNVTIDSKKYDAVETSLPQIFNTEFIGSTSVNTQNNNINVGKEQCEEDISSISKENHKSILLTKQNSTVTNTVTLETNNELNATQSSGVDLSGNESIKNSSRFKNYSNKPGTPVPAKINSLRPPSARPPSARPGAPRLKERHDDVLSVNETASAGKVKVILENAEADAEEDEPSLIFVDPSITQMNKDTETDIMLQNNSDDHGHLVQQILESQKEFTQMKTGKTEIEWEFGAQKSREASHQEIEQLRFNLQALSRAANPLGKLLDHIQEDVEAMRQELNHWTKTYEDAKVELAKEKSGTLQALQPLEAKSKQFDEEIADRRDKINDIKSAIYKNSMRIDKLLGNTQY